MCFKLRLYPMLGFISWKKYTSNLYLFWMLPMAGMALMPLVNSAQNPGFEMNYPAPYAESARSIAATSDGGYVMAGLQGINIGVSNIAIRKVNAEGEEQWVQYLGDGGSN